MWADSALKKNIQTEWFLADGLGQFSLRKVTEMCGVNSIEIYGNARTIAEIYGGVKIGWVTPSWPSPAPFRSDVDRAKIIKNQTKYKESLADMFSNFHSSLRHEM